MSGQSSAEGGGATAPLRVLVADDEPMIVRALKRLLEREGHSVVCAADAFEAASHLDGEPFDAVLVDRRMPGDGLNVIRKLDDMGFAGVVVLMTGAAADDPLDVSLSVRRLQKPFPFVGLISILEGRDPEV